jgi:hypothetical protein
VWHSASRDAAGWHGKPRALRRDNGEGGHAKGASGAQPRVESGCAGGPIRWAGDTYYYIYVLDF